MFQTAALVHDDIIDDPIAPRQAVRASGSASGTQRCDRRGLGIMLGDMLATSRISPTVRHVARHVPVMWSALLLTMHREVEIGQVLDLAGVESAGRSRRTGPCLIERVPLKTASYTTIAPLKFGMLSPQD